MEVQAIIKDLLVALIQLAIMVLAGYAVKWVRANVSQKQMDLAISIAQVVVNAAEQLAAAGKIDYKGKFEAAMAMAREQAKKWGLELTDAQWNDLIEAAVKAIKTAGEEIKKAPQQAA